jgi:hypothetical protein
LRRFVETTYPNYVKQESDFPLKNVIEYYISSARQDSPENKFAIGFLGLASLASNAPNYAEKVGDEKLENKGAVAATEKRIKEFLEKRKHHNLTTEDIRELANELAYKEIGDKRKI